MPQRTLQQWLSWQESLNPREIDLGLERVRPVLRALGLSADFFCPVITVAGTNGKGSTLAFIESILHQSGVSVGCYSSPHLFHYNERVRIDQQPVSDACLCAAFEEIDRARGDIPLTYFEFGTLAALLIFKQRNVQQVVLEVGLGGRLDAVNMIDADVSVISSIALDHTDWLGNDLESIGREKAGIMRESKTTVIAFFEPPESLLAHARALGVKQIRLGQDYLYQGLANGGWQLKSSSLNLHQLAPPGLQGDFQLQNAAAAIMAIDALSLPLSAEVINRGLQGVQLAGRFQTLASQPRVIVDVAHNPQAAQALAQMLAQQPVQAKTLAVVAMLADKAQQAVLQCLLPEVDEWLSAGLDVPRGLDAKNMAQAVREVAAGDKLHPCNTLREACEKARALATPADRILVFGSFHTVAQASHFFKSNQ